MTQQERLHVRHLTDGHMPGRAKEDVQQNGVERGVKAINWRHCGEESVGQTCGTERKIRDQEAKRLLHSVKPTESEKTKTAWSQKQKPFSVLQLGFSLCFHTQTAPDV